ncbi:MAG: hypothetical protein U9Q33_02640 [Campylobacterota bacterium]|nr:hypothetical protein [Campylobacterota bacterium]
MYKKSLFYIFIGILLVIFTGCGGGASGGNSWGYASVTDNEGAVSSDEVIISVELDIVFF